MRESLSVLVVRCEPALDDDAIDLDVALEELGRRPSANVTEWFLRRGSVEPSRPNAEVVDDLRALRGARVFDRLGVSVLSGLVRGRELRRWYQRVAPDIVLFDGGVGDRVIPRRAARIAVVARDLAKLPQSAIAEPRVGGVDLELTGDPLEAAEDPRKMYLPRLGVFPAERSFASADKRNLVRRAMRLPVEAPLLVGWPDRGDHDTSADFFSVLTQFASWRDKPVHGLWLEPVIEPARGRDLRDRADSLGLGSRLHVRSGSLSDVGLCADVAVSSVPRTEVDSLLRSELDISGIGQVFDVDSGTLHGELALALGQDRQLRSAAAESQLDPEGWADQFVAAVDSILADRVVGVSWRS